MRLTAPNTLSMVCLLCSAALSSQAHAAASKAIEFSSPRGGEVYSLGQKQSVVLGAKTLAKSLTIELSRDGGTTFESLGTLAITHKSTPTFLWTVSLPSTSNAVIRATSTDAKHPGSSLSGAFSIGMLSLDQSTPDTRYVQTAGDTMTGLLTLSADPTANLGAATKQYVDNSLTGSAQNFVNLTTNQTAAGNKTFTGTFNVSTCFTVEARPTSTGGLNNFVGMNAGAVNTTGLGNTFMGHNCGKANIGGSSNSFYGLNAGSSNTSGQLNVFIGQGAGAFNDSGSNNNYVGQAAGFNSFSGNANNFFGWHAGFNTSAGSNNAFFGDQAGAANNANNNTFVGSGAGASNSSGTQGTFLGINAGNKTTGSFNTLLGAGAGQFSTSGVGNTLVGNIAGNGVTTGSNNTYVGGNTGGNMTTESHNTLVGDTTNGQAGVTNATAVGANAFVGASNSLVLGSVNGVNGAAADTFVGIGTTTPNSYLQVSGSLSLPIRSVNNTSLIGLSSTDYVLVITGTTASTIVLPQPGVVGRIYIVKNRATVSASLAFLSAGPTIDGAASLTVPANTVAAVICDGNNWFKIN